MSRGASADEIRKQYFLLARKWHPDKNPGDESVKEVFQKLGAAYQVLSDPELRKRYDEHGSEAVNDVNFVDGALFFAMLFGSVKFEKFIGELLLTSMAHNKGDLNQGQVRTACTVCSMYTCFIRIVVNWQSDIHIEQRGRPSVSGNLGISVSVFIE